MWNIDSKYLRKDETIEYIDRPSMLSCTLAYIWVCLQVLIITIIIVSMVVVNHINMTSMRPMILLHVLMYTFFALPAIYIILKRLSTRYVISSRGLTKRIGIITTDIKTIPFEYITSIEVKKTMIGKMFRYSHLLFDTSRRGQTIEFQWRYVKSTCEIKKLIEKYIGGK